MPLTMRNITTEKINKLSAETGGPSMTITTDVLDFLGYEGADKEKQKENFIFVMIMKMMFGNYISKK